MLKLDVTADIAKATEHLSELAQQHVPNAAAKALTRTAFDARDAVRDGLPERSTCAARGLVEALA